MMVGMTCTDGKTKKLWMGKGTARYYQDKALFSEQYSGAACRFTSEKVANGVPIPFAAVSIADGSGNDASPMLPKNMMSKKMVTTVAYRFLAFTSDQPGAVTVGDATLQLKGGKGVYKARFGSGKGGVLITSSVPVWGVLDCKATHDEQVLYGDFYEPTHTCNACPTGYDQPELTKSGLVCPDTNGCADTPCHTLSKCTDVAAPGTGFKCGPCPKGYVGNGIGEGGCKDYDACSPNPCAWLQRTGVEPACTDLRPPSTGFTCAPCPTGYDRSPVKSDKKGGRPMCQDTDECAGAPCDPLTSCTDINAPGTGYNCSACPSGYSGTGKDGCVDINDCTKGQNNPCGMKEGKDVFECKDAGVHQYTCTCTDGYKSVSAGSPASSKTPQCLLVNQCAAAEDDCLRTGYQLLVVNAKDAKASVPCIFDNTNILLNGKSVFNCTAGKMYTGTVNTNDVFSSTKPIYGTMKGTDGTHVLASSKFAGKSFAIANARRESLSLYMSCLKHACAVSVRVDGTVTKLSIDAGSNKQFTVTGKSGSTKAVYVTMDGVYTNFGNGSCANQHAHASMAYSAKKNMNLATCQDACNTLGAACVALSMEDKTTCLLHSKTVPSGWSTDNGKLFHDENTDFTRPTGIDSYNRSVCWVKRTSGSNMIVSVGGNANGGNKLDYMPVVPEATTVYGIPSTQLSLSSSHSGAVQIRESCSDGSSKVFTVPANQAVLASGYAQQYAGKACKYSSETKLNGRVVPFGANTASDGSDGDATPFLPKSLWSMKFATSVDYAFIAFVSDSPGTVTLGGTSQKLVGEGNGVVYSTRFTSTKKAGEVAVSTVPVWAIMEDASSSHEQLLFGDFYLSPGVGAQCNAIGKDKHTCTCPAGFEGDGKSQGCSDIDGCASDPCPKLTGKGLHPLCTDMVAPKTGYTCGACPTGYDNKPVKKNADLVCVDTDSCKNKPCSPLVKCVDQPAPGTSYDALHVLLAGKATPSASPGAWTSMTVPTCRAGRRPAASALMRVLIGTLASARQATSLSATQRLACWSTPARPRKITV